MFISRLWIEMIRVLIKQSHNLIFQCLLWFELIVSYYYIIHVHLNWGIGLLADHGLTLLINSYHVLCDLIG